ncbi:hypothetical protein COT97_01690 [Candidatus Falkowbacteria bacterium CG10_big_fil_rev_8_21_14_0_10_39_11]|uniref:Uncharacterized protein n=1 Tax=Candidatus Falkowbacteria bacterium CG10_big_fil_rev_8_21_14_0_10_39_11 TaxID=1974565 RepID=A0A2H0V5R0_9BACT|nr:MAG: hypothetical protein COT97_01690 [Candidatus Falkowbacteria bacterium CG10_big_fil_rev_8_21_14_0_10_39_11]
MTAIIIKRFTSSNQIKAYYEGDELNAIYTELGQPQAVFHLIKKRGAKHGISIKNILAPRQTRNRNCFRPRQLNLNQGLFYFQPITTRNT